MSGPVEPGIPDAEAFEGECHYFALALHELAGGELVYVGRRKAGGGLAWGHVAVALADGRLADASGVWEREDMLAEWESDETAAVDPDRIRIDLGGRITRWAAARIASARESLERDGVLLAVVRAGAERVPAPSPR